MTVNGIPNDLIKSCADGEYIDYSALIADKAVEFTAEKLSVNNVVCDYDLWTKQSYAVDALGTDDYFYFDSGAHVPYGDGLTCHTDYLGKPNDHQAYSGQAATKDEKWVSYYDSGNNEVSETDAYGEQYDKVSMIVIWCYNYPKEYSVDIFGADSFDDVTQKIVGGNTVYVANPESADTNVKSINKLRFYYNQRFCKRTGDD